MRRIVSLCLIGSSLLVAGCAGHSAQTAAARTALDAGQPKQALAELNDKLGVKRVEDLPPEIKDDKVLFVLDRSMVLMQLNRFDLASRDLEIGDKQLMVLDFSHSAKD